MTNWNYHDEFDSVGNHVARTWKNDPKDTMSWRKVFNLHRACTSIVYGEDPKNKNSCELEYDDHGTLRVCIFAQDENNSYSWREDHWKK